MAKAIDFPTGLTFHVQSTKSKFVKDLKHILNLLSVPYNDKCCGDTNNNTELLPVSYNATTGALQYTNGDTVSTIEDKTPVASAINSTAVATAAQVATGLITSTSAAATNITLPSATDIATEIGAARGTKFWLTVDNSVGASLVTVVLGGGAIASSVLTGGTTLTVASGTVGQFLLYFESTTGMKVSRIA